MLIDKTHTLTNRTPLDFTYRQAIKKPQPTNKEVPAKSWAPKYEAPSADINAPANGGPDSTENATIEKTIPKHKSQPCNLQFKPYRIGCETT